MTADQEAFDVAWVITDVAALHQPDYRGRQCGTCVDSGSHPVPWMCNTARVVMALTVVMDILDEGEAEAKRRGLASPLIRSDQLRSLIAGAINFTPPEQR